MCLRSINFATLLSGIVLSISLSLSANAGWNDLLKQGEKILQSKESKSTTTAPAGLDTATLAKGLKEALKVGGERAISQLSTTGGFANSKDVRIPMPGVLESAAGMMRKFGLASQVDAFEASMNAAAERAIKEATPIFVDTLESMTLDDAKKIYSGGNTAATDYFRSRTLAPLGEKLHPLIDQAMAETGVIKAYTLLMDQAQQRVPMLSGISPNISDHVTESTLKGLFTRLGQEEKRIREQPIARSSELLKTVFGR